jgi:hypothetical protein
MPFEPALKERSQINIRACRLLGRLKALSVSDFVTKTAKFVKQRDLSLVENFLLREWLCKPSGRNVRRF